MASILRNSVRVSSPITSNAKSSASLATRACRSRCRCRSVRARRCRMPRGAVRRNGPAAGPVVPLTETRVAPEELLGGGGATPAAATGATVTRALIKGEALAAPSGRADDFRWPRDVVNVEVTVADRRRPTPRRWMPAPNPPSPPSASQRWMLTPLSAGSGLVSIAILGLTSVRASRSSGRMAGSSTLPPGQRCSGGRRNSKGHQLSRRPQIPAKACGGTSSFIRGRARPSSSYNG
jgi:hypothetical protein